VKRSEEMIIWEAARERKITINSAHQLNNIFCSHVFSNCFSFRFVNVARAVVVCLCLCSYLRQVVDIELLLLLFFFFSFLNIKAL
jgi:hypothetical protein